MGFRTPQPANINSTSEKFEIVTASATELPHWTRKIRVGGAGNLVVKRAADGTTVTIAALAGEQFTIAATHVFTGTTATDVLVHY